MLLGFVRLRSRRVTRAILVLTVAMNASGLTVAHAGGGGRTPDANLSMSGITFGGTRDLVKTVQTQTLRASVPAGVPDILIIGTGVERALFPVAVQASIVATGIDAVDPHGYGTIAASTILQLMPDARITSKRVGSHDGKTYNLVRMTELRDALEQAYAARDRYDLVLLAYPPQAALDPVAHAVGVDRFGRFGTGLNLVTEAMLSNPSGVAAIPSTKAARDAVFAGLNLTQREAVERYARQAAQWNAIVGAVRDLDAAGVPIVAPAGDFTRTEGDRVVALPTQTVFGLAADPSVITVGASFTDGSVQRVSPTSGRGPTLSLAMKPDLLAPSDVMTMLPAGASLPWPDDSLRAPLQTLQWARAGVTPSPCPSVQSVYRCTLQGASIVSASVVAANLGAMAASGTAASAGGRADEVLRGLAWARASKTGARAFGSAGDAFPWERGAGVLGGLKGIDIASTPIALGRADLGEVGWTDGGTATVALWDGGARAIAEAVITSFVGPDQNGSSVTLPFSDRARIAVTETGGRIGLRAPAGPYQGGIYAGELTLAAPGDLVRIPVSLTQTLPLDAKASYAFNELQTGGPEGERVEDASVVLFVGLPSNVGLIGTAFKNLSGSAMKNQGGDPTNNLVVRHAVTKNSFTDPGVAPSQHGTARIPSVPPGFYRIHLLADHGIEARQQRGRTESLGIRLGSFGPEAAFVPGSEMLLGAQPPCGAGPIVGPFAQLCVTRSGTVDPATGFCTASNSTTRVAFNVYCAPVSFAVPSAVASRAVHLIEHDATAAKSEWTTCGLDVPVDGSVADFARLAGQAETCDASPGVGSSWTFPAGAPGCLAPSERQAFPGGHPADLQAVYKSAAAPGVPGRAFPVAVMTYRFKLPSPNTYTTAALSLSYVADNAIVGVRFRAGSDPLADSSNGVLLVDQPGVSITPALTKAPTAGSTYNEWAVMSANATEGQLSIIVIPTTWVRPDLDPMKAISSVQLCDVGLRVLTFAKQSYGNAAVESGVPTQHFTGVDRGLTAQIDPRVSRVRPVFEGGAFRAAGVESESLHVALHIPKNTTRASSPHRVLSPLGGPAHPRDLRRFDGARRESILAPGFQAYDPGYGIQSMDCARDIDAQSKNLDHARNALACRTWEEARAANTLLAELSPTSRINGRFAGILSLDHATLARAASGFALETVDADDGGAFESRWARAGGSLVPRFEVSDFYDDAVPLPLTPLSGALSVARNGAGAPILRVLTSEIAGASHVISAALE